MWSAEFDCGPLVAEVFPELNIYTVSCLSPSSSATVTTLTVKYVFIQHFSKEILQTIKPDYETRRIHKLFRVSHNNVPAVADLMKQHFNVSDKPVYMRTNCTSHEALKE